VSFESLSFTASNAAIEVDSVSALKAKLVTSNAPPVVQPLCLRWVRYS